MTADSVCNNKLRLPAVMDSLHEFQKFALKKAMAMGMPEEYGTKLELVIEELVVNIIHYAYPDGPGKLELCCRLEKHSSRPCFCVKLKDWGIAFNPLERDKPDTALNVTDRPVGGLGIFLAEKMSDVLYYERTDNSNILTCCFEKQHKVFD